MLIDESGEVGTAYGAKTTPHMYVVNPDGVLIYKDAIDDKPTTSEDDIPGARNFVPAALDESMAGKPVSTASTPPYGCSVKIQVADSRQKISAGTSAITLLDTLFTRVNSDNTLIN